MKPPVALPQDSPRWRASLGRPWFWCFPSHCRDKRRSLIDTLIVRAHWSGETHLEENASTLISLNYSELKETRSLYLQTHRSEVRFQSVSVAIPSVAHSCTLFLSKHKMLKANSSKWLQFFQESEGRLRLAGQRCQSSGCFVTRLPGVIFAGGPGKSLTDHLPALHRCFGGHYVCHLILTVAPSPRFQKVNYGSE